MERSKDNCVPGKYYGWMEKKNGKKKKRREANVIESMI